jgi:hypothetical protein
MKHSSYYGAIFRTKKYGSLSIDLSHFDDQFYSDHSCFTQTTVKEMTNPFTRSNRIDRSKHFTTTIDKLCGKVARMLVGLAKSGKVYDSAKVFPQAA